ncbi:hypothetical protein IFM89_018013 [Coptis chinensis]|uniref:Exportin-4 n=1 Tax=Coptis chinensis TaxID=261450 RepID=A0A835HTI2_9MAGN|nr:hypothetical protein IFM89_018013 [Coptis chinensis]
MESSLYGASSIDISQLQQTMQAIEYACTSIQMHVSPSESEATILSLRQSPHAYQKCRFILENSQVGNARFQAVAALRDVAVREWGLLQSVDKKGLISFCLGFLFQHSGSAEGYLLAKISAVAAQLLKRGCKAGCYEIEYLAWPTRPEARAKLLFISTISISRLDFTLAEKEAFLSEVKQVVLGVHGFVAQFIGMNFLESMVSEFSPSTSSSMGLPREFHEQCRDGFELEYLKQFYCWAQDAALSVTNRIVECDSDIAEVTVCSSALKLMFQILNWDFQFNRSSQSVKNRTDVFASSTRDDVEVFRKVERIEPGSTWRDTLLSSGHITWLLGLYRTLRHKFSSNGYWLDSPLAESARKLIVHFCSLTGTIFPADNGQMQEQHLLQMLSGIIQWIDPPHEISAAIEDGKTESEMLDGCRALLSIATLTTPLVFDKLLKSFSPFGTLSLLSSLTCEVLKARMACYTDEETWSWVARDILLDTWTALLVETDVTRDTAFPPEGITAAATVFELIVEAELKGFNASSFCLSLCNHKIFDIAAARSAFDEEDDCDYLRASISDISLSALEYFIRCIAGRGTSDPTCTLEELYSLLLITGHVLADAGEGETPLVPEALLTHFVGIVEAEQHPVIVLSSSIIRFAEKCLDPDLRASFFSPRLMEAVTWFLARWSDTYVMSREIGRGSNSNLINDHERQHVQLLSRKILFTFCGEHDQGKLILDSIVCISLATLISYPGENDLQALTCYQLLPALVRRSYVCVHLVTLDSWKNLANTFANERTLFSLTAPYQRSLAEILVRSAIGMKCSEASNQYVRDLMRQITAYLVDLSSKNGLKTIGQQPDAVLWVSSLFERLRGAARATEPRTQNALYEMGVSVMSSVLALLEVYKHEPAVVYVLLKFVVDWVNGQIVYLEAKDTAVVVNFCLQLLQLYSSHNIGKISVNFSISLLNGTNTEKYKDLRALLQLLTSLCSKDLVDFSSDSNDTEKTDIAQVIYLGLHIVTPLISMELLKYPKLCHDYFALLSHMLEVYPEKVAQLNAEMFAHLVATLDFGIHNQDSEVVNNCLGALNALASYHYKERGGGREGLGSHASGFNDLNGQSREDVLSRFLKSLLQLLLFEDYSSDLVSSAADALLPLILCAQGLYQRLGHELIERQATPELKSRLANALQVLTSSNQLSSSLDRVNYQRFRKNLLSFLFEVRGFLRTI